LRSSVANSTKGDVVTKFGVIIPICIMAASGCSLNDTPQVTTETSVVSSPASEGERIQPVAEVEVAPKPAAVEPRSASVEDIRRLQVRLRELSFDPGPVDGIAGGKTKGAFARLQAGCAKLEPLSETVPIALNGTAVLPNRDDTSKIQRELRKAGFDPGPVDGIFGIKTKSVISRLEASCAMAKELRLDVPSRAAGGVFTREASKPTGLPSATAALPSPAAKPTLVNQTGQGREEIRILQLRLRDAGFDPGPFDGVMGQKTKLALEQYEASKRNKKTKTSLMTSDINGGQY
jgi:peptidoglycan hydrolase-like protein with peptidoglycan-binding domain